MSLKKGLTYTLLFVGGVAIGGFAFWRMMPSVGKLQDVVANPPVTIHKGTEVNFLLLTELEGGREKVGDKVTYVVADPVFVDGKEVIPAGAMATGQVSWSRSGSVIGTLTNNPARLRATVKELILPSGEKIVMRTEVQDGFEFTLANTDGRLAERGLTDLINDPKAHDSLKNFATEITQGKMPDGQRLEEMANDLGLSATKEALKPGASSGDSLNLADAAMKIKDGDFASLSGVDIALAARAINELETVGRSIDTELRGRIKGRNITARIGTPVKALVWETTKVRVPKSE